MTGRGAHGRTQAWWALAAMLAFLAATNKWMSWNAAFRILQPHDETDYAAIARAAPHLPVSGIQLQHGERFVFHWLIGMLAHGLGAGVEHTYEVLTPIVAVLVGIVLVLALSATRASWRATVLCLGVVVLNTYSLRYYVLAPGYVGDLIFEVGILLTILGLFRRRYWLILVGVVAAALARQSTLPTALALAVALWCWPGWREGAVMPRAARALAPVVLSAVIYVIEEHVARRFSYNATPGFSHFTMLSELAHLPSGASTLGNHLLRSVNGLLAIAAMLVVVGWGLWRTRKAPDAPAREASASPTRPGIHADTALPWQPVECWGPLLIGASVALQAMAFSASYAAANETRLSVIGLGPISCGLAVAMRELARRGIDLPPRVFAAMLVVLAIDSVHHVYTTIGTANAHQTVALQFICAAALLVIGLYGVRRRLR
jgi:hypothetical protein